MVALEIDTSSSTGTIFEPKFVCFWSSKFRVNKKKRSAAISSSKHPQSLFNFEALGVVLIRAHHLKEGGIYFKVRGIFPVKFQNIGIFSF